MSQQDGFDRSLASWLDAEAHPAATADVLDRALRVTRGRRPYPGLFAALGSHWIGNGAGTALDRVTLGRSGLRASMALLMLLLVLALVGAVIVGAPGKLGVALPPTVGPTARPSEEPRVTELLNDFIQARVDGLGTASFLSGSSDVIPLLYASSSGASYERGEFERVPDIGWPYGWTAFKVRLFAGDTVVEQLFFTSPGPGGLTYHVDGFRTDIVPTTEDGQPVGVPVTYLDGEVTVHNVHPWVGSQLIPEGARPTTDGGERNGWERLVVKAVPADCQPGGPHNAERVAEGIRSDPDLEATPPLGLSAGGASAVMMDVVAPAGSSACGFTIAAGERMRLYLIDAPEGSSMRVLAIAISVPEGSFARAVAPAASMVDSVEFRAP